MWQPGRTAELTRGANPKTLGLVWTRSPAGPRFSGGGAAVFMIFLGKRLLRRAGTSSWRQGPNRNVLHMISDVADVSISRGSDNRSQHSPEKRCGHDQSAAHDSDCPHGMGVNVEKPCGESLERCKQL